MGTCQSLNHSDSPRLSELLLLAVLSHSVCLIIGICLMLTQLKKALKPLSSLQKLERERDSRKESHLLTTSRTTLSMLFTLLLKIRHFKQTLPPYINTIHTK